jgi:SAM-dependent methyltransferase
VTVLDNSPRQLERDREVATREDLEVRTVLGDMRDLAVFPDARFDVVFHPVSNVFCPDLAPDWREAFRVLRPERHGELPGGDGEVMARVVIFEEARWGRMPAEQLAGQRAGGGDIGGEDHPERAEVVAGLLWGGNGVDWQV